jgi:hypothetical protein
VSVVLVTQQAKRMRHIISSSVACYILPQLSTSSRKTTRYSEESSEYKHVIRFSLRLLSETFLIIWGTERDIMTNAGYAGLRVKYPLFLSRFNEAWIFSTDFRRILLYQISWKSVQWEPSCSMRTDGRTDRRDEAVFVCPRTESSGRLLRIHKAGVFWSKGKTNIRCIELFELVTDRKKSGWTLKWSLKTSLRVQYGTNFERLKLWRFLKVLLILRNLKFCHLNM